jgi:hypothetical protein
MCVSLGSAVETRWRDVDVAVVVADCPDVTADARGFHRVLARSGTDPPPARKALPGSSHGFGTRAWKLQPSDRSGADRCSLDRRYVCLASGTV